MEAESTTDVYTRTDAMRSEEYSDTELLYDSVGDATLKTYEAMMEACGAAVRERRELTDQESSDLADALKTVKSPVITYPDALAIMSPETDWFNEEQLEDGIEEHAWLHLGRPGECGQNCPAFSPLKAE